MNPIGEFFAGVLLLPRGLSMLMRRPTLFWRGAIPPIITSVLFVVALVALVINAPALASAVTPFADDWSSREPVRAVVAVLLVAVAVLLLVVAFSALTLALGGPIYDAMAERLEADLGGLPEEPRSNRGVMVVRGLGQAVILIALSVLVAIAVFLIGLIPVAGTVLAALLGACLGGWLVAIDLVGTVFERRGRFSLRERDATLRLRRWRTLGFAAPTFVLLSMPLVAIVAFPVAKAAATILARQALGEPTAPTGPPPS